MVPGKVSVTEKKFVSSSPELLDITFSTVKAYIVCFYLTIETNSSVFFFKETWKLQLALMQR